MTSDGRLGNDLDVDRLGRHDPRQRPGCLLAGRIDDRGANRDRGVAGKLFPADKMLRHGELEPGRTVRVRPPLQAANRLRPRIRHTPCDVRLRIRHTPCDVRLCIRHTPCDVFVFRTPHTPNLHRDFHLGVRHRLAEEVAGSDRAARFLARLIVRLVERKLDLELGQDVLLHLDADGARRVAHLALDLIGPLTDLVGQRTVGRRDAEAAGDVLLAEDHVPLGIADRVGDVAAGHRFQIRLGKRQAPQADHLAGLVNRLVAAEHQPPGPLELHRADDALGRAAGLGRNPQLVLAPLPIRQPEARAAAAPAVRREADQADRPAGLAVGQLDFHRRPCDRPAALVIDQEHAERGPALGHQLALPENPQVIGRGGEREIVDVQGGEHDQQHRGSRPAHAGRRQAAPPIAIDLRLGGPDERLRGLDHRQRLHGLPSPAGLFHRHLANLAPGGVLLQGGGVCGRQQVVKISVNIVEHVIVWIQHGWTSQIERAGSSIHFMRGSRCLRRAASPWNMCERTVASLRPTAWAISA